MFRNLLVALPIVAIAIGGSSACATKKYVKTQVDDVAGKINDKVDTLSKSLEETQERTRKNEQRIGQTEQRLGEVDQKAQAANTAAATANTTATAAGAKAEAVEKTVKRLIYEVTLSEEQGNFKIGQAELPPEVKARVDELVAQLKANPNGAYLEIEGHTDSTGPAEYNRQLGLQRAEAVKNYLYEAQHIPLHKMNVISFGPDKPVAPNTTREGRAKNRRVVIKVLA
ncbi:MAG: oprF [Acidobacteria bacterium]|nr:oprF [Acidobacteriota bacterium]